MFLGLICVGRHIGSDRLLGENDRDETEESRCAIRDRDPAGFDSQDLRRCSVFEQFIELLTDLIHEPGIDLVIQEVINLQDISRQHLPIFSDTIF